MRIVAAVLLLALAACSTEGKVTPMLAASAPLPAARSWSLSVHGCQKPSDCNEVRVEVLAALLNASLIEGITPPGQLAPAALDIDVTRIRDVSMGERILFGAMAGRNEIVANVTLKNDAGLPLRSFKVESASAAHPLSGKTSAQDAYRQFGSDIVSGLR